MKLIEADVFAADLPACQCVVTSPPYYKQRKYTDDPNELGQEKSPSRYVHRLSELFLRIAEKLPRRGTLFINIADKFSKGVQLGIPWRLAFALVDGGLVLKNECIWHKLRMMPQSNKRRFTCSHEQVFFFVKDVGAATFNHKDVMEPAKWFGKDSRAGKGSHRYKETREANNKGHTCPVVINPTRFCRSVWEFTTRQEGARHSATFPFALAERCVLAGSNKGDIVFDPFAGTCTTGYAAEKHGRRFVGIDIDSSNFPARQS